MYIVRLNFSAYDFENLINNNELKPTAQVNNKHVLL